MLFPFGRKVIFVVLPRATDHPSAALPLTDGAYSLRVKPLESGSLQFTPPGWEVIEGRRIRDAAPYNWALRRDDPCGSPAVGGSILTRAAEGGGPHGKWGEGGSLFVGADDIRPGRFSCGIPFLQRMGGY